MNFIKKTVFIDQDEIIFNVSYNQDCEPLSYRIDHKSEKLLIDVYKN